MTWTYIASGGAGASSQAAPVTASGLVGTGATLIVVAVAAYGGINMAASELTDSSGNAYTLATIQRADRDNNQQCGIFYKISPAVSASMSFTYTPGNGGYPSLVVKIFSSSATPTLDGQVGSGANVSGAVQAGAIGAANDVVVEALNFADVSSGIAIDSSFDVPYVVTYVGGQHMGLAASWKAVTGSVNPIWTNASTNADAAKAVAFLSGGSTPPPPSGSKMVPLTMRYAGGNSGGGPPPPPPPFILTTSLPDGVVGVPYNQTLTASGGSGALQWSVVSGTLPAGLSLGTNGILSGTPTATGTNPFSVQVIDALNRTDTKALSLQIDAPAPVIVSAASRALNGTLESEKAFYANKGWAWTTGQLPQPATVFPAVGTPVNIHSDTEGDMCWFHCLMFKRTGLEAYYTTAKSWANYFISPQYITDLDTYDLAFGYDHVACWGLAQVDAIERSRAKINGTTYDGRYATGLQAVVNHIKAWWYSTAGSQGDRNGYYAQRGPGRHMQLAASVNDVTWITDIWTKVRDAAGIISSCVSGTSATLWDERTIGGVQYGIFKQDPADTSGFAPCNWAVSSFENAELNTGVFKYWEMTGDTEAARRLLLWARWMRDYGFASTVDLTGHWCVIDWNGLNQHYWSGLDPGNLLEKFYVFTQINTLLRGYIISKVVYNTPETTLYDKAVHVWTRGSKVPQSAAYPYTATVDNAHVGMFFGYGLQSNSLDFVDDCGIYYAYNLFHVAGVPSITQVPNSALQSFIPPSWVIPGSDGASTPLDNIWDDWCGGCGVPNIDGEPALLSAANGGHTSYFYNGVLSCSPEGGGWKVLRDAYKPYIPFVTASAPNYMEFYADAADGSKEPGTRHTYGLIAYDPVSNSYCEFGGSYWSDGQGSSDPIKFDLGTRKWTAGSPLAFGGVPAVHPLIGGGAYYKSGKIAFHTGDNLRIALFQPSNMSWVGLIPATTYFHYNDVDVAADHVPTGVIAYGTCTVMPPNGLFADGHYRFCALGVSSTSPFIGSSYRYYDLDGPDAIDWTYVTLSGAVPTSMGPGPGAVWEPDYGAHGAFIVLPQDGSLVAIELTDATHATCTLLTPPLLAGTDPLQTHPVGGVPGGAFRGTWGRFWRYDSRCYMLASWVSKNVWLIRI